MSTLTKRQRIKLGPKLFTVKGEQYRITADVRHDDDCGNGYNSFSILCTVEKKARNHRWTFYSGGCQHEEFSKHWPEYAHLTKWHGCGTNQPTHYIANTLYLAGDKDCNGLRKGDVSRWAYGVRFGNSPITHKTKKSFWDFIQERKDTGDFSVHAIAHGPANEHGGYRFKPKYTLMGYAEKWHECPFDSEVEALEFCEALNTIETEFVKIPVEYSDGKERELDKARSVAVWPDATDEDLTAPGLRERLETRLPKLLSDMRSDVEAFGFIW